MLASILLIALSALTPLVSASAAGQFHLDVNKHASQCWLQCHAATIAAVHNTYDDPLGNNEAIGNNCKDEPYITTIPTCLVSTCISAPDVAYALEFGQRWCAKAGVDVSETLKLPEVYTEVAAKEYFQSQAYLSAATPLHQSPTTLLLATTLVLLPLAISAL